MRRITDIPEMTPDGPAVVILRPRGHLRGERVDDLRRTWRRLRGVPAEARIRVELAEVRAIDAAGRALLREMRRHGVEIHARDGLMQAGSHDAARPPRPRVATFRPRARVVARPVWRRAAFVRSTSTGVLIRLAERRVSRERPRRSSGAVWLIVVAAATFLAFFVWRSLR